METKNMNVNEYVAPEVELLQVEVEAGFAGSDGNGTSFPDEPGNYPSGD